MSAPHTHASTNVSTEPEPTDSAANDTEGPATDAPPSDAPPGDVPPGDVPPSDVPPTEASDVAAAPETGSGDPTTAEVAVEPQTAVSGARTPQLEREGEIAADFLETLLDIADLDGDLEVDIDGDRAAVSIVDSEDGTVPRRLIGSDGEIVEALQELARLSVQAETGERSGLMLDVGGYRADRRETVLVAAKATIAEVSEHQERRAMSAMTAYERKVVHDEVLKAGLRSESEGEEPGRHVVVLPSS